MVIQTNSLQLFQILQQKLGAQEAEALVTFVDAKLKEADEANLKILATKEDFAIVKQDLLKMEGTLRKEIAESKVDIIKWMIATAIGIVALIVGFMKLL